MKTYLAASAAMMVLLTFLVPFLLFPDLVVQDKQAPGTPGQKTFQLRINDVWYVVPEMVWDQCKLTDRVPACAVSALD